MLKSTIDGETRIYEYRHNDPRGQPCFLDFDKAMAHLKEHWDGRTLYRSDTGAELGTAYFDEKDNMCINAVTNAKAVWNSSTRRYEDPTNDLSITINRKQKSVTMKKRDEVRSFQIKQTIEHPNVMFTENANKTDLNMHEYTKGVSRSNNTIEFVVPFEATGKQLYIHSYEDASTLDKWTPYSLEMKSLTTATITSTSKPTDGDKTNVEITTPINMRTRIDATNLKMVTGKKDKRGDLVLDGLEIVLRRFKGPESGSKTPIGTVDTNVVEKNGYVNIDFDTFNVGETLSVECFVRSNKDPTFYIDDGARGAKKFGQYIAFSPDPHVATADGQNEFKNWPYESGQVDILSGRYTTSREKGVLKITNGPTVSSGTQATEVLPQEYWIETEKHHRLRELTEDDTELAVYNFVSDLKRLKPVTVTTIFTDAYRLIQDHAVITLTTDFGESETKVTLGGGNKPETNGDRYEEIAATIGDRPGYEDGTLMRTSDSNKIIVRVGNGETAETLTVTNYTVASVEYVRRLDIQTLVDAEMSTGQRIFSDDKIIMAHVADTFMRDDLPIRELSGDLRPTDSYAVRMKEVRDYFGDAIVARVLSDKKKLDLWMK